MFAVSPKPELHCENVKRRKKNMGKLKAQKMEKQTQMREREVI